MKALHDVYKQLVVTAAQTLADSLSALLNCLLTCIHMYVHACLAQSLCICQLTVCVLECLMSVACIGTAAHRYTGCGCTASFYQTQSS